MTDWTRYCFLPFDYKGLGKYYKLQSRLYWNVDEINMSSDRDNWNKLDNDVKQFIKFVLGFFAQADGLIQENLVENFQKETSEIKEAKAFYSAQNFIEEIHNETYSAMIDVFIQNHDEKTRLFNAIDNYPSIKNKALWMKKWMNNELPLLKRIVAFACVEGIFFTGSFCAIYWLKINNALPGLCKANEFIQRDEAIHTYFASDLYLEYTERRKLVEPLTESEFHEIIKDAVENVEIPFVVDALRVDFVGMDSSQMTQYIKFTADVLCKLFGYKKLYNVTNPFDWIVLLSLQNKTNFFEEDVSEYAKVVKSKCTFQRSNDF